MLRPGTKVLGCRWRPARNPNRNTIAGQAADRQFVKQRDIKTLGDAAPV